MIRHTYKEEGSTFDINSTVNVSLADRTDGCFLTLSFSTSLVTWPLVIFCCGHQLTHRPSIWWYNTRYYINVQIKINLCSRRHITKTFLYLLSLLLATFCHSTLGHLCSLSLFIFYFMIALILDFILFYFFFRLSHIHRLCII